MSDTRRPPSRFRVQEFLNTARRLQSERQEARTHVPSLLRATPSTQWHELAERQELHTYGVLEHLGHLVSEWLTKHPTDSLALASLAVSIADQLYPANYPAVVFAQGRAHASADLAKVLRFLGRHAESIEASNRSLTFIEPFGWLTHDRAVIRFELGVTLGEIERYDESLAIVAECKEVFREHGDTHRVVVCGIAEGVVLQRLRKLREAREIYLLLLASTDELDPVHRAAIHHAIGFCSVDLGDFTDAESNLEKAITIHQGLGQAIQAAKGELGLGRLLLRTGAFEKAVTHLRIVRRLFLRNALAEEAGLCGLEVVEGLLALNRVSEAETLARKIVNEFILAQLNRRAVMALAYLSEAIASNHGSSALTREVHEYVLSLRIHPEREFAHHTATASEQ